MPTRISRTLIIARCCLLALAASAHAECAWVLWVKYGDNMDLETSYTSGEACIRDLDAKEKQSRSDNTALTTRTAATGLSVNTGKLLVRYQCLPDTVDARGPKGK